MFHSYILSPLVNWFFYPCSFEYTCMTFLTLMGLLFYLAQLLGHWTLSSNILVIPFFLCYLPIMHVHEDSANSSQSMERWFCAVLYLFSLCLNNIILLFIVPAPTSLRFIPSASSHTLVSKAMRNSPLILLFFLSFLVLDFGKVCTANFNHLHFLQFLKLLSI